MADEQQEGTKPEGEGETQEPETFDREYVHKLREEAKSLRTKYRTMLEEKDAEARKKEEATAAQLAEQGKYKELYEKMKPAHDALAAEIQKYRDMDKLRREALLAKLPEDKRELYGSVDTEVLADVVETLTKDKPTPGAKPGSRNEDKTWDDMSTDEQDQLKGSNKDLAWKLYRESYKKKNGAYPPFPRPF